MPVAHTLLLLSLATAVPSFVAAAPRRPPAASLGKRQDLVDTVTYTVNDTLSSLTSSSSSNDSIIAGAAFNVPTPSSVINAFNASVGGRLAFGYPLAQPCFSHFSGNVNPAGPDATQCAAVQAGWDVDSVQSASFGGYPTPGWSTCQAQNHGCLLDFENPANPAAFSGTQTCYQGSVPPLYINVQQPSDIQAALKFASTYGIRLTIKNSGHDYRGRSSGPLSLGLWTRNLGSKSYSASFVAQGCAASTAKEAITLGAGVDTLAALNYAESLDRTLVAGASRTVGLAGGYVAGGGHSAISNGHGLGVDNALQFKVVTPDGTYRTVSRCSTPDLFFALAGGGGSTFGVVTETTFTVHPKQQTQVVYMAYAAPNKTVVNNYLSLVIKNALPWVEQGWGGYVNLNQVVGGVNAMIFLNSNLTLAQAQTSMADLTAFANSLGSAVVVNQISTVSSFYDAFQGFIDPPGGNSEPIGLPLTAASRLVQAANLNTPSALAKTQAAMLNTLNTVYPLSPTRPVYGAPMQLLFTSPFHTAQPVAGATSETPAWRSAVFHSVQTAATYWDSTIAYRKQANSQVSQATDFLRAITPNSGAYQSEGDVHEPNPAKSFWGTANYNKLLTIKKKYDPKNILTCWQCIGWDSSDSRYSCYI